MGKERIDLGGDKERVLQEITDCREDERSAQNLQLQMISITETVLGVIFAATFLWKEEGFLWVLSPLSNLIFLASFSFITYLGIENFIRHHYLVDLEKQYNVACLGTDVTGMKRAFLDWNTTSSTVKTLNIRHIKHALPFMSFSSFVGSLVFALLFCISITLAIFEKVGKEILFAKISLIVVIFAGVIDLIILLIGGTKASEMYKWAKKEAYKKLEGSEKKESNDYDEYEKELKRGIVYFIHPRIHDLQKLLLIPFGSFFALMLVSKDLHTLWENVKIYIPYIAVAFVLVEIFLYPARYHINDIRGIKDDSCENANISKNDHRRGFPRIEDFRRKAYSTDQELSECRKKDTKRVIRATIIKLIIAVCGYCAVILDKKIAFNLEGKEHYPYFMIGSALAIIVVGIIYEYSKYKGKKFLPMILVGIGYALRFFIGFFAIMPWPDNTIQIAKIALLFGIMYVYGAMAVTPVCTLRAFRENKARDADYNYSKAYSGLLYSFSEYHPLVRAEEEHKCNSVRESNNNEKSKYDLERLLAPWNACFIASYFLLIIMLNFILGKSWWTIVAGTLALAGYTICLSLALNKFLEGKPSNLVLKIAMGILTIVMIGGCLIKQSLIIWGLTIFCVLAIWLIMPIKPSKNWTQTILWTICSLSMIVVTITLFCMEIYGLGAIMGLAFVIMGTYTVLLYWRKVDIKAMYREIINRFEGFIEGEATKDWIEKGDE